MKKFFIVGICTVSLLFSADINKKVNKCPDLSKTTSNKDFSNGFKTGLEFIPDVWISYQDILSSYNKTKNIDDYINKDGLVELLSTPIWAEVVAFNYVLNDQTINKETKKTMLEKYKVLIQNINKDDINWCNNITNQTNIMRTNFKN